MPAESLKPQDQDHLMLCDLVMKGGITSGVLYPPAVLVLKQKYRFRSIGGTSAGAIAAAATAAAEYNRERDGFEQLKAASNSLAENNLLLHLFQAPAETRLLLETLLALLPKGRDPSNSLTTVAGGANGTDEMAHKQNEPGLLQRAVQLTDKLTPIWKQFCPTFKRGRFLGMAAGATAGILLAVILSTIVFTIVGLIAPAYGVRNVWILWLPCLALGALFGVLGAWCGSRVGGSVAALHDLMQTATREVSANFYGICVGHSREDKDALTDWLSASIEQIAGLQTEQRPLTFGQLSTKRVAGKDRGITLKMVTSNLSHGQPYTLPFGLEGFLFKEADMLKLFPDYIVQHMRVHASKSMVMGNTVIPQEKLPEGYYFLPSGNDLPVVVGARLSLSFPILISAVPFYTIRSSALETLANGTQSQLGPDDLQKNWFSDGGICSNFPIHFYDAWLPRFPTFGINLGAVPAQAFQNGQNQAATSAASQITANTGQASTKQLNMARFSALDTRSMSRGSATAPADVYLPHADALQDAEWRELSSPIDFLHAIFTTAQNYRDSMQSRLPSYRERVVQIRLNKDEGGLNLSMPTETIKAVVGKGSRAGEILCDPDEFNFEHHWWVRFLVLMALLERNFEGMQEVLGDPAFQERLYKQLAMSADFPYSRDSLWIDAAKERVKELQQTLACWHDANKQWSDPPLFGRNAPLPNPVLRVTPEL